MSKKIYELVDMNGYHLTTQYKGCQVVAEFKSGNILRGMGGRLVTSNRFVQDALENDVRFGRLYYLKDTIPSDDDVVVTKITKKTSGGKKAAGGRKANSGVVVEDVRTFNDAADYFAAKGEVCDTLADIEALCEKYNVEFPNLNV